MILASTTRFPSDRAYHEAIAGMNCELDRLPRQFLVRFQNKTHAISLATRDVGEKDASDEDIANRLLWVLSDRTGWKKIHLEMTSLGFPFCSARVRSSLLGGKGGFGTLLKGQSKQAGAKRTTDFGACRDLQGRRLRHVNDEIKLRKWRERQKREANGEKADADEMWKTASGLYNWHLMVPTWADISKKETNKIKRQFQSMDRKLEKEAALRKEKDEVYQKTMTHYLDQTNSVSESVQSALKDALRQGLKKSSSQKQNTSANGHKRKRAEGSVSTEDAWVPKGDEQPNSLVSLTGDVVVEASREQNASVKIQSKSEFMTAVFVMEESTTPPEAYYYEVTVVSGGLAQIGWASMEGFRPSNDLGDGVGDDASSYALDGSRGLKFHGGNELDCPISWKQGDRLGCLFRRSSGSLQFTLNGKDLGVIFSDVPSKPMVPAFSCNQGEILELHLSKSDCKYFPYSNETVVAVKDVVTSEDSTPLTTKQSKATDSVSGPVSKIAPVTKADEQVSLPRISTTPTTTAPKLTTPEALELDSYQSAKELEALGLDRLKSALMFLQVKCGGTLEQRAERLFSLKGLERKEYPKKVRTKGFVEEQ